ncbi:MAG: cyclic nucleotide-binding domain-containing protein [Elusimicrobia bacterium]|nr:cyclic nucleotide-binding domain-containing protein [Elusimicrobiota bacterium]
MTSALPRRLAVDEATAEAVGAAFKLRGFFPEFRAEHCEKLFPRSGVYQYRRGETIVAQGDAGRDLFLVLAGEVSVRFQVDSLAAEAARLGPGAVVGEMALLGAGVRSATVAASAPSFVFRLAFDDVGYILGNNPELAEHLRALARERASR